MLRSFAIAGLLLVCPSAMPVFAQGIGGMGGNMYYSRPTVSPYLNLGQRNAYGISTYQTLVRPMLEQQAYAERQAAIAPRHVTQPRMIPTTGRRPNSASGDDTARTVARPGRYMNYSHFYGAPVVR
jgi:hypothetical protein